VNSSPRNYTARTPYRSHILARIVPNYRGSGKCNDSRVDSFKFEERGEFILRDNSESLSILAICVRRIEHAASRINLRWYSATIAFPPPGWLRAFPPLDGNDCSSAPTRAPSSRSVHTPLPGSGKIGAYRLHCGKCALVDSHAPSRGKRLRHIRSGPLVPQLTF
jgi:hypothetical protein